MRAFDAAELGHREDYFLQRRLAPGVSHLDISLVDRPESNSLFYCTRHS